MNRKQLLSLFFIVLLLYILYNILLILSPFVGPIFWAAILAFGFYPFYEWLKKRLGGYSTLAAALTSILIFLAFIPIVIFIAMNMAKEAVHLYQMATQAIEKGEFERAIVRVRELHLMQTLEKSHLIDWESFKENAQSWLLSSAGIIGNFTVKQAFFLTKGVISAVLNMLLTFFLLFFFLKDGMSIYRFIYDITPLESESKKQIFGRLIDTFTAVLRGQLFTGAAQALVAGIIFFALGLPLPIFFAALTFLAALIPVIGAAVIWMPLVLYLVLIHSYTRALILLALGTFVISLVDNLLKPYLIGEKTKLPYLLLFLGILGGIHVYGLMGIFLAPAVLSLFFVLIKIYREKFLTESPEPKNF